MREPRSAPTLGWATDTGPTPAAKEIQDLAGAIRQPACSGCRWALEDPEVGEELRGCVDDRPGAFNGLVGLVDVDRLIRIVRIFKLVASDAERPVWLERVAELGPHSLVHGEMSALCRRSQALLG